MTGLGRPSAVQLNTTFCPFNFITVPPVLFHKAAVTKSLRGYQINPPFLDLPYTFKTVVASHTPASFVLTFYTILYYPSGHWRLLEKNNLQKEAQS